MCARHTNQQEETARVDRGACYYVYIPHKSKLQLQSGSRNCNGKRR